MHHTPHILRRVSKTGLVLAGLFALLSVLLISTQGLFGESFIALILGMPWILVFSYFEFFTPQSKALLTFLVLLPIAINVLVLYGIGWGIEYAMRRR